MVRSGLIGFKDLGFRKFRDLGFRVLGIGSGSLGIEGFKVLGIGFRSWLRIYGFRV